MAAALRAAPPSVASQQMMRVAPGIRASPLMLSANYGLSLRLELSFTDVQQGSEGLPPLEE